MRFFALPGELRKRGVLGMNQRNSDYIMRYNPRRLYPLVDNKLETKKLALQSGIAVPELYSVVAIEHQVQEISSTLAEHQALVIKPAHGSGGSGIQVIDGHMGKFFRKANGSLLTLDAIQHHTSNILSGMYSLGGIPDKAILEYRVDFDPMFEHISYQGVPDIRIIVFRGIPTAAMIRLPTRDSDGKANLHQGAVGLGVNITTGVTTHAVHHNQLVDRHPDTGHETSGIVIPHWDDILRIAMQCADTVGLGYLGVDIVIDRNLGPLMLELNARPGLSIQIASGQGLLTNLQKVQAQRHLPTQIDARLEFAKGLNQSADIKQDIN
ncbi:MAG: alpha-L-glutamate ligase-like protein [Gammaproteobacteria bacterium]